MVNFSRRWNGDGFFSPTMEWRWFLKILTITIDGMVPAQPLAAMVFQGFFQFWGPMVHNGYAFSTKNEIRDKMRVNEDLSETKHGMKSTSTQVDINQGTSCSRHCKKIFLIFQKLSVWHFLRNLPRWSWARGCRGCPAWVHPSGYSRSQQHLEDCPQL